MNLRRVSSIAILLCAETSNWTFFEQGATVVAKIEDDDFWKKVHERTVTFGEGEGDTLVVELAWKVEQKSRLVQRNTILKVLKVIPHPEQLQLHSESPVRRISRRIRDT